MTKSETVTVRLTPGIRQALRDAAERDHRSVANMIEVLVRAHCQEVGIEIQETRSATGGKKRPSGEG